MTQLALLPPRYDLVVLDLQLPGMSGYAIASWFRDHCAAASRMDGVRYRRPLLVAVSADPDLEARAAESEIARDSARSPEIARRGPRSPEIARRGEVDGSEGRG